VPKDESESGTLIKDLSLRKLAAIKEAPSSRESEPPLTSITVRDKALFIDFHSSWGLMRVTSSTNEVPD